MKKKNFLAVIIVASLAIFSACNSSNEQNKSNSNERGMDSISKSEDVTKESLNNNKDISEKKQDEVT